MKTTKTTRTNRMMRMVAVALCIIMALTGLPMEAMAASKAGIRRVSIYNYNEAAADSWYDGMKLSQKEIERLNPVVKVQLQNGESYKAVASIAEKNKYLHAKNGRVTLTFSYKGFTKKESIKLGVRVKKLVLKKTGKPLYAEQTVSLTDARKSVKATAHLSNGRNLKNFKGFLCKEEDKPIRGKKQRLTLYVGKVKKTVSIEVIPLIRITIDEVKMTLAPNEKFNIETFKKKAVVKGKYKNGKLKTLENYSVTAKETVAGVEVTVTCGNFSDKVLIPREAVVLPPEPVKKATVSLKKAGTGTGRVTADGVEVDSKTVVAGTNVNLGAIPDEGCYFAGWQIGGTVYNTNIYSLPVTSDVTVKAVFEKIPTEPIMRNVVVSKIGKGSLKYNTAEVISLTRDTVEDGSQIKLELEAEEGNYVAEVRINGENEEVSNVIEKTVKEDMAILVIFKETPAEVKEYTVNLEVEGNGKLAIDGEEVESKSVPENQKVALTPEAAEGWRLKEFQIGDKVEEKLKATYFHQVTEDVTVKAVFEEIPEKPIMRNVVVSKIGKGTVKYNGVEVTSLTRDSVENGSQIRLELEAAEGNYVAEVRINGENEDVSNVIEKTVEEDMAILVIFKETPAEVKEVTVSTNGGIVKINGKETISKSLPIGSAVIIELQDTEHFKFRILEDKDGNFVTEERKYSFMVTKESATNFVAVFDEVYDLSIEASHGCVKEDDRVLEATNTLLKGNHHLVAVPDEGYELDKWTDENGNELSLEPELDVLLDENKTVVPHFKRIECTLTLRLSENAVGSAVDVKLNGNSVAFNEKGIATESLYWGTPLSIKSTGTRTKFFNHYSENGVNVGTTLSFDIKESKEIVCVFENAYELKVYREGGNGRVYLQGQEQPLAFNKGVATEDLVSGTYNLEAPSNDDFEVVEWTDKTTGKVLSTGEVCPISLVGNTEIVVKFREIAKTVNLTFKHEDGFPEYGVVLRKEAVELGGYVEPPTSNIARSDKTFAGWKIGECLYAGKFDADEFYYTTPEGEMKALSDDVKAMTAAGQDVVAVATYIPNPVERCTFTVINGSITKSVGGEVTLISEDGNQKVYAVDKNTHVYLNHTEAPEGYKFAEWSAEDGETLSYYKEYDFFLKSNEVLEALFVPNEEEVEVKPIVRFDKIGDNGEKFKLDPSQNMITFYMISQIPTDKEKVEWGLMLTTKPVDDLSDAELQDVNGRGSKRPDTNPSTMHAPNAGLTYELTFKTSSNFDNHVLVRACIYATITNAEGTRTVYSPVVYVQL